MSPGTTLDIAALANELGMSHASIQEALGLLVHEHLVEAPPRGLYVADLRLSDLEKISTIRLNLETLAAQQAARNATTDDLVILQSLCSEEAGDTKEAVKLTQRVAPQLTLVDVILGEEDGIRCTRRIRALSPESRVILISAYPDKGFRRLGLQAGAVAFLDKKDIEAAALRQIIEDVAGSSPITRGK